MDAYTIPAPDPGEDTTFTLEVWEDHGSPSNLILAEGWAEIEQEAFTDSPVLEMIRIPASVVSILESAFNGAIELRQVEFAQGSRLEFIGDGVFARTEALERIRIPASVTMIEVDAFSNATGLREVTFEEGSQLESIGQGAFSGATALERIRIPRLVDTIMSLTFENATSLREVTFEEGSQLEFIYDGVFRGATALQTIQIPASVLSIREDAFANTTNLRQVIFEPNSEIIHIDPNAFRDSGLELVVIGEIALERLNVERNTLNLTPLHFGPNNNFYGRDNVTIVSRAQQMYAFRGRRAPGYRQLPRDAKDYIAKFLMPPGAQPKSSAALAARAEDSAGGARKPRTRKRGIRRNSRKASRAQKTKKRKSKRRRTMKRK